MRTFRMVFAIFSLLVTQCGVNKKGIEIHLPVILENPKVELVENSERVRFTLEARLGIPLVDYRAQTTLSAGIDYQIEDHSLRLDDLVVEDFQATKLPEKYAEPLKDILSLVANQYLQGHSVYELKKRTGNGKPQQSS